MRIKLSKFENKVYEAVKKIPRGKVSAYSDVARAIGRPGVFRAVGNALNKNFFSAVPCHRVVRSDGRVGGFAGGGKKKIRMLQKEGIGIKKGKVVDLKKVLYKFLK